MDYMPITSIGQFIIETQFTADARSFRSAYELSWGEERPDGIKRAIYLPVNLRYVYTLNSLTIYSDSPHKELASFTEDRIFYWKPGLSEMQDTLRQIRIELVKLENIEEIKK